MDKNDASYIVAIIAKDSRRSNVPKGRHDGLTVCDFQIRTSWTSPLQSASSGCPQMEILGETLNLELSGGPYLAADLIYCYLKGQCATSVGKTKPLYT